MSNFADFNVGTIKLNTLGENVKLTGSHVITSSYNVSWSDLLSTIQAVDDVSQEVVLKEDIENKSTSISIDATSDIKYPSVKAVKTYVDVRANEQTQFVNSTLQVLQHLQEAINENNQSDTMKEDLLNKSTNLVTDATSDTKYPTVKAVKSYIDTIALVDDTKEDLLNKSTNLVTDATSDTKYPTVKAVKSYIDNNQPKLTSLVVVEGESNLAGQIRWTCGSCPMEGIYGLLLPSSGKVKRIAGIAYGTLGNLDSIQVTIKAYALNLTSYIEPVVLQTILFQKHPTMSMLYAHKTNESILPTSSEGVMLIFQESLLKDNNESIIDLPLYVRFRLTFEYESSV